jgi:hypothetical protein
MTDILVDVKNPAEEFIAARSRFYVTKQRLSEIQKEYTEATAKFNEIIDVMQLTIERDADELKTTGLRREFMPAPSLAPKNIPTVIPPPSTLKIDEVKKCRLNAAEKLFWDRTLKRFFNQSNLALLSKKLEIKNLALHQIKKRQSYPSQYYFSLLKAEFESTLR